MINNKNIPYFIIVALVAIIIIMSKCNTDLKQESFIANNNLKVSNDSLVIIKNKYGQEIAERGILISDMKGLKELNYELYKEVEELKKGTGNKPKIIIKTETKIVHDTVFVNTSITALNDSLYEIDFAYDTTYSGSNSRTIEGVATIGLVYLDSSKYNLVKSNKFKITKDQMNIDATLAIGEKDGQLKVWLKSDYPGFSTESIEAVTLDPEIHPELRDLNKKSFTIGPYIGIGIGQNFTLSPSIGVGVQWAIFKF